MNTMPLGDSTDSWVLRHDSTLYHRGEKKGKIPETPQEGDVIVSNDYLFSRLFSRANMSYCSSGCGGIWIRTSYSQSR